MDTQPVAILEKTIGNTIYIVEYSVSASAKETAYEKVKKRILNDTERYQNIEAS